MTNLVPFEPVLFPNPQRIPQANYVLPVLPGFYFHPTSFCSMSASRDLLAAAKGTGPVRLVEELTTSWLSLAFWLLKPIYVYVRWRFTFTVASLEECSLLHMAWRMHFFWSIWRLKSSKVSCSCSYHSFFCWAESLVKAANCPLQFGPAKRLNLSHPTQQGVVAVGLHGLVRRDQQFWALHIMLRIHVQPSSALAGCLLLSAGQHRYFWGSVVSCMKDLIWVCNSLDWGMESFNPHFSPCLFHLCDVPVCWQKRRWHRPGNMPWEEPASSSSSTQLGHLKWLRNCGLSCPVV